jgi:hypothetical protein
VGPEIGVSCPIVIIIIIIIICCRNSSIGGGSSDIIIIIIIIIGKDTISFMQGIYTYSIDKPCP